MRWYSLLFIACCALCQAQIVPVTTLEEIKGHFQEADQRTLAVFDVDLVLIAPEDPAFHINHGHPHELVVGRLLERLTDAQRDDVLAVLGLIGNSILVDPAMPQLLSQLQERGVPTMALTANLAGQLGRISNMAAFKRERLAQFGIDFRHTAPHGEAIVFFDLTPWRASYPTYEQGMLFSSGATKGDALVAFLRRTGCKPCRVIFVDDRKDNLESVEAELAKHDASIEVIGLHYEAWRDHCALSAEEIEARWTAIIHQALALE